MMEEESAPSESKFGDEVAAPAESSMAALLERFYLKNEIDLSSWNAHPTLAKVLPALLNDQKLTAGILLVAQKRPQELLKKIHLLAMRTLRKDGEFMEQLALHSAMFKCSDFKKENRTFIANNRRVFNRVCSMSFFKQLYKMLLDESKSDIKKNLLEKYEEVNPDSLKQSSKAAMDGKRERTFKKPYTVIAS